jgi:uncharacterized coiled-coil protein SlyX
MSEPTLAERIDQLETALTHMAALQHELSQMINVRSETIDQFGRDLDVFAARLHDLVQALPGRK